MVSLPTLIIPLVSGKWEKVYCESSPPPGNIFRFLAHDLGTGSLLDRNAGCSAKEAGNLSTIC